jgi:hypothetical protein
MLRRWALIVRSAEPKSSAIALLLLRPARDTLEPPRRGVGLLGYRACGFFVGGDEQTAAELWVAFRRNAAFISAATWPAFVMS